MATNELLQFSVVSALMDGVASDGMPVAELLTHGDHGLGTFRYMVGEMIVLDGKVYQMRSDGTVATIDPAAATRLCITHGLPSAISMPVRSPELLLL